MRKKILGIKPLILFNHIYAIFGKGYCRFGGKLFLWDSLIINDYRNVGQEFTFDKIVYFMLAEFTRKRHIGDRSEMTMVDIIQYFDL